MTESLMTVIDVSKRLCLSPRTINKLVRENKIECYELSRKKRVFDEEHITAFLKSRERSVPKPVDKTKPSLLPSPLQKGGAKSSGVDREALRKEMQDW